MTAAQGKNGGETGAAVFFTGLLTLAAGGAGLAIAGLVLGFDYLLHGEPGERQALAERRAQERRDRYADALAWLEADRVDRARARAAVREWFVADRATRGDRPTSTETAGRVLARMWNHAIVGMFRFRKGWKAGRDEARNRRAAGAKRWWMPDGKPVEEVRPTPPPNGTKPVKPQPTTERAPDVIDAEIIPSPTPQERSLVPVGTDAPAPTDNRANAYDNRLNALRAEVEQNRNARNDDPSPPLSALR